MNLLRALRFEPAATLAFVGAGGKTSALFQLAREINGPVIVIATTHLGVWQIPLADRHIIAETPEALETLEHGLSGVILVTGPLAEDRTQPVSRGILNGLHQFCGYYDLPLLIEADGARQHPLKAPDAHEPPVPKFVQNVAVVAGLSGLGKPLTEETVHRPEIFASLSGLQIGATITPEALVRVMIHPAGGLKNIPPTARRIALLNQADTAELQSIGGKIAKSLLDTFDAVIVGSLQATPSNLQTFERIAGIILAAGASTRFGQPKQLLDWRGQPFVRAVAQTALAAGLSPVIVVTGANAEGVEAAVRDLPVKLVRNAEWQEGQASSMRAGVGPHTYPPPAPPLPPPPGSGKGRVPEGRVRMGEVGGAIFLLTDQPQIQVNILQALIEAHARELPDILAPMVHDQRANPVLFDRRIFSDMLELKGDVGGRGIFHKHRVEYLPWHDDRLLLDVDTPEHYQRLVEDETL